MANKQFVSFAFLAMAVLLLAGEAAARRQLQDEDGDKANAHQHMEMIINDLIGATQRARSKVPTLGNSKMVKECEDAYTASLDSLNKALVAIKQGPAKDPATREKTNSDISDSIMKALQAYDTCDDVFAKSTRPSPFIPNNANLKSLGNQCLELTDTNKNNV